MDLAVFLVSLEHLSGDDLRCIAAWIGEQPHTAADEVEAWEDLILVDGVLRTTGRKNDAAYAAHAAVSAVHRAAEAVGDTVDASLVTRVAREAALVARTLVAGDDAEPAATRVQGAWSRAARSATAA
jgi:hypothetical protein